MAKKTYRVPNVTLADLASQPKPIDGASLQPSIDVVADAKPIDMNGYLIFWNAWAVLSGSSSHNVQTEAIAQSPVATYAFATGKHIRYDVVNQLQSVQFAESGFSAVVHKKDLRQGQYTLWLHLTDGKTHSYFPLNQSVVVS